MIVGGAKVAKQRVRYLVGGVVEENGSGCSCGHCPGFEVSALFTALRINRLRGSEGRQLSPPNPSMQEIH